MVTKVAGGIVGLGLISTGSIAMAKPHWLGMDYMPGWHSLSEDTDFETSSYTDKFGGKYKNYLVGVTKKKGDQNNKDNQSWWEWSFRRLDKEATKNSKFGSVENDYGTDTTKDLNQVCKEAYGKTENSDFGSEGGSDKSKFKKSDVWKYCSPGLLTHTNKDNPAYSEEKIGGTTDNKSKLVSIKDSSNDWFWEIRNKDFWSKDTNDWSGQKATGDGSDKSIFKKEYETNKTENNEKTRKTIKKLCEEAYDTKKKTDGTDNNNEDAKKFCVLETTGS